MAYDDVLAKVLCTLEVGTLAKKLSAGDISNRYRKKEAVNSKHFRTAEQSIEVLNSLLRNTGRDTRFNKATLFSWLIFLSYFVKVAPDSNLELNNFLVHFNENRERVISGTLESIVLERPTTPATKDFLLMRNLY